MKFLLTLALVSQLSSLAFAQVKTPLGNTMSAMGDKMTVLASQVTDPNKNVVSLQVAGELETLVTACLPLVPDKVAAIPDAGQKAAATLGYKKAMNQLLGLTLDLETQLLNGDNAGAQATMKKMGDLKKVGHSQFK